VPIWRWISLASAHGAIRIGLNTQRFTRRYLPVVKPAAGLNPIEIAVDIDLQQLRWMVGRTTRCSRINALKTTCAQVEFIDENVDHPDWIFFGYVIVQTLRQ